MSDDPEIKQLGYGIYEVEDRREQLLKPQVWGVRDGEVRDDGKFCERCLEEDGKYTWLDCIREIGEPDNFEPCPRCKRAGR